MTDTNWVNLCGRIFISAVVLVCATEIIWHTYNKVIDNYRNKNPVKKFKAITDVFFFSESSALCKKHLFSDNPCPVRNCPVVAVQKLSAYLLSAKRTLDICVYFLTFSGFAREIIKLKNRNVFVRIITDDESQENDANQILNLRKAGIQVRSRKSVYLMHHKFAIVDKTLLITGSANWTLQAFFGNCENVLVTNQFNFVNAYNCEFETLWLKFNNKFKEHLNNN